MEYKLYNRNVNEKVLTARTSLFCNCTLHCCEFAKMWVYIWSIKATSQSLTLLTNIYLRRSHIDHSYNKTYPALMSCNVEILSVLFVCYTTTAHSTSVFTDT